MNLSAGQNSVVNSPFCLWDALRVSETETSSFICDAEQSISRADVARGSILNGRGNELRGQCVIVITADQLTAGMALIELDGIARRIVVYPNESSLDHLPYVIEATNADAIVSDLPDLPEIASSIRQIAPTPHTIGSQIGDRQISTANGMDHLHLRYNGTAEACKPHAVHSGRGNSFQRSSGNEDDLEHVL